MIDVQLNLNPSISTKESHILFLPSCCPVSSNPQPGSSIEITYQAKSWFLEVASLKKYIQTYVGGKDNVRSMEGMIQQIAQDCSNVLGVKVTVIAKLKLIPNQKMIMQVEALPKRID